MSAPHPPPTHARPFAVAVEASESPVVIVLHGELDMAGTPSFALVMDEVAANASHRVVFDLADLSFIDAGGISAILSAARDLEVRGVEVAVRDPQRVVRRLFLLCGLDDWAAAGEIIVAGPRVGARPALA